MIDSCFTIAQMNYGDINGTYIFLSSKIPKNIYKA